MADLSTPWAEAAAQGSMPQRCLVNVKPVGRLAKPDLPSFRVSLSTSHSLTKSASRLIETVMHRLNLQSKRLFSVSIAGEQLAFLVTAMLEDFMEEMRSKLQSVFDESDAIAGQLTTFCDLSDADRHATAAAAGQAAAARQAATAGSQPAPTKEKRAKNPNARMNALGTKAANLFWPRTRPNDATGWKFVLREDNRRDWVEPVVVAWVASKSPALAAKLDGDTVQEQLLKHVGKHVSTFNSKVQHGQSKSAADMAATWTEKYASCVQKTPSDLAELVKTWEKSYKKRAASAGVEATLDPGNRDDDFGVGSPAKKQRSTSNCLPYRAEDTLPGANAAKPAAASSSKKRKATGE